MIWQFLLSLKVLHTLWALPKKRGEDTVTGKLEGEGVSKGTDSGRKKGEHLQQTSVTTLDYSEKKSLSNRHTE